MFIALTQSIKALRANLGRTMLTMLGIIIGIGTVIMVLSAGAGFRALINKEVEVAGTNTVYIQTRVPPTTKNRASSESISSISSAFSGVTISSFKQRDLDDIKKLPNVVNNYGLITGQALAIYRSNKKTSIYYGASASRFDIDKSKLAKGRFYTEGEDNGGASVAVLGSKVAEELFGQDDPVGKVFKLKNINFQVIGVYKSQGALSDTDGTIFIPITTAQKKLLGIDYMMIGIVQLADMTKADSTIEQIKILMRDNHNITDPAKDDFSVQTPEQALETFNTIFDGITYLLIAIAPFL